MIRGRKTPKVAAPAKQGYFQVAHDPQTECAFQNFGAGMILTQNYVGSNQTSYRMMRWTTPVTLNKAKSET
jgi:hypothetical protein